MPETKDLEKVFSENDRIILRGTSRIANFSVDSGNKTTFEEKTKENYHEQRLGQSKWAFRLSVWGGIAGFIVIVISLYQVAKTGNIQWLGVVSGAIIETVSVLFYTLTNMANDKISEFFIALTKDTNVKKALNLADGIDDRQVRDELKVKLSLYLAGINEEKICKNTRDVCKDSYSKNSDNY